MEFPRLSLITAATVFGKPVRIEVEAEHGEGHVFLVASGFIVREIMENGAAAGIRFALTREQHEFLLNYIARHGFSPTGYVRSYPRIASDEGITTFPLYSVILPHLADPNEGRPFPIALDILNLSPGGVLLATENQAALSLRAGDRFNLLLEPRGWFPSTVALEGQACRVIDDRSACSGNVIRQIGVKFVMIDPDNRLSFLDLLADILTQLRASLNDAA